MLDMRVAEPRPRQSDTRRSWLELILLASVVAHVLILAIIVLAKHFAGPPAAPQDPGYEIVFDQGDQRTNGSPSPEIEKPKGEEGPPKQASSPSAAQPSPTQSEPQVNLSPEEYAPPPPPQSEAEEYIPPPPRPTVRRPPAPRSNNPFAGMPIYGAPSRMPQAVARGIRGSHSMNLSLGLNVQGGQLREAVPHVSSPGADGDYLEALSDYVETHKYYPEVAARNREAGVAVISATIRRDGTVLDVKLLQSSGSRMLDVAWMGMFRAKHLPPFPDDMRENERKFTLSMDYEIIYQ
jgi:protein TonB